MIKSTGRRAALTLAGSALAMTAIAIPATAAVVTPAGYQGWRAYHRVTVREREVLLGSIDAVSASDAWVAGISGNAKLSGQRPLVEHWNGWSWRPVSLGVNDPALTATGGFFGYIAASPGRNVWAFSENGSYVRLHARHWMTGRVPRSSGGHVVILSATAFSRTDVWAFGTRYVGPASKLDLVPYAARFNGTSWTTVPMPGKGVLDVSAQSPDDMWALISALTPGSGLTFRQRILHWDGEAWTPMAVQPPRPRHADLDSILGLSQTDAWVAGGAPDGKGGTAKLAIHWNGTSWTSASPPGRPTTSDLSLGDLVADGDGGLWAVGGSGQGAGRFWHYSAGRWTSPATARWYVFQLAAVPGTDSTWGIAASAHGSGALIIVHGPVPR
jgi:hypothetical protein